LKEKAHENIRVINCRKDEFSMATFAFPIGDFIAGINLIIKHVDAMKYHGGARTEYQAITGTLSQISNVLEALLNFRCRIVNNGMHWRF
jgi:hypothetical protein